MVARTYSATLLGVNAVEVEIESNDAGGNPKMMIVGLTDASMKESRERVTAAIASCGFLMNDGVTEITRAQETAAIRAFHAMSMPAGLSGSPTILLRSTPVSAKCSAEIGSRSLDLSHVAAALEAGFMTFVFCDSCSAKRPNSRACRCSRLLCVCNNPTNDGMLGVYNDLRRLPDRALDCAQPCFRFPEASLRHPGLPSRDLLA